MASTCRPTRRVERAGGSCLAQIRIQRQRRLPPAAHLERGAVLCDRLHCPIAYERGLSTTTNAAKGATLIGLVFGALVVVLAIAGLGAFTSWRRRLLARILRDSEIAQTA